ncbi:Cytochrome P450 2L1 [Armadillidium nasatum]|uniref:Cytochrome P450 2L1 n=1 Tax=Armadillidium nasatum TaxID=96803 RepID=A0A5N5T4V7_9CRUS|nr:Cytochrome P450 2L1 [Armadillidium nasatum]
MTRKISKTLKKLQSKYGEIYTVKLGSKVFIVLSDYSLIKSALQRPEISGRPVFHHFNVVKKHSHIGVILAVGQVWTTNRRFSIKTLRDFGLGKTMILDDVILNEAQSLVQDLKESLNKPIEIEWNVNVAILNVIWKLVADRRYEVSDKDVKKFSKNINDNFEDRDGALAVISLFPWLIPFVPRFIMNKWMLEARIVRRREEVFHLLLVQIKSKYSAIEVINDHKRKLDKENPKDLIDKYLIEKEEQKNNPDYQHWGDDDLLQNMFDFFIAGSETTSSTIRWFFLFMGRFPDIQRRVQKEIDENVPKGQCLSLQDKDKLPTLEALIFEVNRNVSLLPNALPHEVTQNTVLGGYDIPKENEYALVNLWPKWNYSFLWESFCKTSKFLNQMDRMFLLKQTLTSTVSILPQNSKLF